MGDWVRLELDGAEITGLMLGHEGEAVAFGARGDRPLAARLGPSGVLRQMDLIGTGTVTSACSYLGQFDFVVGRAYPLLVSSDLEPNTAVCQNNFRIEDETTEGAVRLWTVCASGEDVTVLTLRGDGWLHHGVSVGGHRDDGVGLRIVGDVEEVDLIVSAPEPHMICVAGPLVGGDGTTSLVWEHGHRGWVPAKLGAELDAVTHIRWGIVAGHRGLRPVVSGWFAGGAPELDLDPDWPHVTVVDHSGIVALQSTDGPQLWRWLDGEWQSEDLPRGRLTAGVCTNPWDIDPPEDVSPADDRLYVVIDGNIWHRATG